MPALGQPPHMQLAWSQGQIVWSLLAFAAPPGSRRNVSNRNVSPAQGVTAMSNLLLAAVMVAAFVLAIGLVQVLSRMIEHSAGSGGFADEPPDPNGPVKQRGTLR